MELQKMLDRGYGLYIINELLSLRIHNFKVILCIGELPGYPYPASYQVESYSIEGIHEECFDYINQYLTGYTEQMLNSIIRIKANNIIGG